MKTTMRNILPACFCLLLLCSCGGLEPPMDEEPTRPAVAKDDSGELPYCGDGICDSNAGEDEWWCVDCGYSVLMNGPKDGGYCGDGVCFGGETVTSCFRDCRPKARRGSGSDDPPQGPDGWGDPIPPLDPPGPWPPPGITVLPSGKSATQDFLEFLEKHPEWFEREWGRPLLEELDEM